LRRPGAAAEAALGRVLRRRACFAKRTSRLRNAFRRWGADDRKIAQNAAPYSGVNYVRAMMPQFCQRTFRKLGHFCFYERHTEVCMSVINFQAARDRKLANELAALIWFILGARRAS
jgi:hypothetical protein